MTGKNGPASSRTTINTSVGTDNLKTHACTTGSQHHPIDCIGIQFGAVGCGKGVQAGPEWTGIAQGIEVPPTGVAPCIPSDGHNRSANRGRIQELELDALQDITGVYVGSCLKGLGPPCLGISDSVANLPLAHIAHQDGGLCASSKPHNQRQAQQKRSGRPP